MNYLNTMRKLFCTVLLLVGFTSQAQQVFTVSNEKGSGDYTSIYDALDAVAAQVSKSGYPNEGIEVLVKDGYYKIDRKILLSKEFSGTESNPLVIKAEHPEKVHFFGGDILDFSKFKKFKASKAGFTLSDPKAASKIRVLDLKKSGIKKKSLGAFFKHGYGFERNPNFTTPAMLWVDGERMHLSRWPNEGEKNEYYDNVNQFKGKFSDVEIDGAVSMVKVIDKGVKKKGRWYENENFLNNGGGTFEVAFDRAASWKYADKSDEKIWLDGVLSASWEWEYTRVKKIEGKQITLATGSQSGLGVFRKVTHFHFENVPEELDSPGEYFIDRKKMLLYFYPIKDAKKKVLTLATLSDDMIEIKGASNITIDGLVLESGRESAISVINTKQYKKVLSRSENIRIQNCMIRNFNQWGVLVQGAHNSIVDRCHIYNMGAGGVKLGIELRQFSLVKENNVVSNCEIHHVAFDQKSQVPGITLAGCGNTARNNEIYSTPHFAIKMKYTNDCVAEKNYMHNLPEYHHFDGGALYLAIGNQFYNRGNVIRQNYFENISTNGAYLDNYTMGNTVESNVFFNVGNGTKGSKNGAVYIHGGGQNLVKNNIAIDCPYAYKTGSHIVRAANTTNYLNSWFNDAATLFKPSSELYKAYTAHYPQMKTFVDRIHNAPVLIKNHANNKTMKAISNKQNKKAQLDAYDTFGAKAFLSETGKPQDWSNWFQLRYQSTVFENNITCFATDRYLPDFKKTRMSYKLGGSSGVFAMAPYVSREGGKLQRTTNHVFKGNKVFKTLPSELGLLKDGTSIVFKKQLFIGHITDFEPINFVEIGVSKQ